MVPAFQVPPKVPGTFGNPHTVWFEIPQGSWEPVPRNKFPQKLREPGSREPSGTLTPFRLGSHSCPFRNQIFDHNFSYMDPCSCLDIVQGQSN